MINSECHIVTYEVNQQMYAGKICFIIY